MHRDYWAGGAGIGQTHPVHIYHLVNADALQEYTV